MLNLPGITYDRQAHPVHAVPDAVQAYRIERQERLKRMGVIDHREWKRGIPFGPYLNAEATRRVAQNVMNARARIWERDAAELLEKTFARMTIRAKARRIIAEAEARFGFPRALLFGSVRTMSVVRARQWLAWELARTTPLSSVQIGRLLGGRDHTTILNSIRRENERQGAFVRTKRPDDAPDVIDLPALPVRRADG